MLDLFEMAFNNAPLVDSKYSSYFFKHDFNTNFLLTYFTIVDLRERSRRSTSSF